MQTCLPLLRRIATAKLPMPLSAAVDIKAAIRLHELGLIQAAAGAKLKGRNNYGAQDVVMVKQITDAGRVELAGVAAAS